MVTVFSKKFGYLLGLALLFITLVSAQFTNGNSTITQKLISQSGSSSNVIASPVSQQLSFPLSVKGNQILTSKGNPVHLRGVDRSGTEYACVQNWGFSDGPINMPSVQAMTSWHINSVRIPLNEDCWLGINGVNPKWSGINYQNQIKQYVSDLNSVGIVAIIDLHWNAPGSTLSTGQQYMADQSHAPAFWNSVATTFKTTPGVIFDLYNEPHNISWQCWLSGCTTPGGWQAAGMQELVNVVRSTGATQPIMLNGNNWGGDLSQWLQYEPIDPLHNLIAGVHIYNFSACNTQSCWNSTIAPVAAKVPVVTGEVGQNSCSSNFVSNYMNWADTVGISYLAWTWDTWGCSNMGLISNYDGTPTTQGQVVKNHYTDLYNSTTTTNSPTPIVVSSPTTTAPTLSPTVNPTVNPTLSPTTTYQIFGLNLSKWNSEWGQKLPVQANSSSITISLNGNNGYVGISSQSSPIGNIVPGQKIIYVINNQTNTNITVAPFAQDSNWGVHWSSPINLAPGINTFVWTVPAENGIKEIGFQINNSSGAKGNIVLNGVFPM